MSNPNDDPIAMFWTIIAGATAYAILGSSIISAVYLIAQAVS